MLSKTVFLWVVFLIPSMSQAPRTPNLEIQRAAMKKLDFLIGSWAGTARVLRASGEFAELIQTEEASYKLDGLILMVEGIGKNKSNGELSLQALGLISYDDEAGVYRMRAFNDGRWLESDVKLAENGKGLSWGFVFGEIKSNSSLRITENGEWTEAAEVKIGSQPARKFMELAVKPQR